MKKFRYVTKTLMILLMLAFKFAVKFSLLFLVFSSCSVLDGFKNYDKIYQAKNINKSIHNLEVMEKWVEEDYQVGLIPRSVANNYFLVLENTKKSLFKKQKKLEKYILVSDFQIKNVPFYNYRII